MEHVIIFVIAFCIGRYMRKEVNNYYSVEKIDSITGNVAISEATRVVVKDSNVTNVESSSTYKTTKTKWSNPL